MRRWFPLAVLAPALMLAGCPKGTLGDLGLEQFFPKITFDTLKVNKIDFQHVDTMVVFNVDNPNPIKLVFASFGYDFSLAGNPFLSGVQDDGFALEPKGSTKLKIPVSVKFKELIDMATDIKGKDEVPFRIAGTLGFNTPLGKIDVPLKQRGNFPVLRTPKVKFQKLRVGKLNLLKQSVTINLDLGVSHEQGKAMTFDKFAYALKFNGKKVTEGLVAQLGSVEPGAEKTVSLPIQLNLLDLGSTIVSAITNKTKLDVGLDAGMDVGTPFGVIPLHIDETGKMDVL